MTEQIELFWKKDPLREPMRLVRRFRWLGSDRIVAERKDGTFMKGDEHEFEIRFKKSESSLQ